MKDAHSSQRISADLRAIIRFAGFVAMVLIVLAGCDTRIE